jgi:hypothetical protein
MKDESGRVVSERLAWGFHQRHQFCERHGYELTVCIDVFQFERADPAYFMTFDGQELHVFRVEIKPVRQVILTVDQVFHDGLFNTRFYLLLEGTNTGSHQRACQ